MTAAKGGMFEKAKGAARAAPKTCHLRPALLGPFIPARQILFLLRRQAVDLDAHGFEFQFGDALIEVHGNGVNLLF